MRSLLKRVRVTRVLAHLTHAQYTVRVLARYALRSRARARTVNFTSLGTCVVRYGARVIKLLPQDSEHASRLRTRITLTHVRSEVKLTVRARARERKA